MSDIWLSQSGKITINIPEIEELTKAMNRIANEIEKSNNKNGKHLKIEGDK